MKTDPRKIDFFVRNAVTSLWTFPGVETGADSCSGHLESGERTSDQTIIQYVSGFREVGRNQYEFEGRHVDPLEFKRSSYIHNDQLIISPIEDMYSRDDPGLKWTGFHLLFSRFDTTHPSTGKLQDGLQEIYSRYAHVLGMGFGERNRCYGIEKKLKEVNGIQDLVDYQASAIAFWKEIEELCRGIVL